MSASPCPECIHYRWDDQENTTRICAPILLRDATRTDTPHDPYNEHVGTPPSCVARVIIHLGAPDGLTGPTPSVSSYAYTRDTAFARLVQRILA